MCDLVHRAQRIGALGIGLLLVAFGAAAQQPRTAVKENALPDVSKYKSWAVANKIPYYVAPPGSELCAAYARPSKKPSPHDYKYIRVYANPAGRTALLTGKPAQFPVGSVIVKEKVARLKPEKVELLTVMVKRSASYDTKHGDWEYAVFDGAGQSVTRRGRLESCQGCHQKQADKDYVFRTYLTKSGPNTYIPVNPATGRVTRR